MSPICDKVGWFANELREHAKEYHYRSMDEDRREPRITVSIQGRYRTGSGIARDVIVSDLSTMGCKFYDRFSNLKEDSRLTLRIGNIGPIDAVVRWRAGQIIGVKFDDALNPSVFDHMLTTIDDWSGPKAVTPTQVQGTRAQTAPALDEISICIRPPTMADFRKALSELRLALPLTSEESLEAVFHHVLNAIFVAPTDE
jgi:hypothetical protein